APYRGTVRELRSAGRRSWRRRHGRWHPAHVAAAAIRTPRHVCAIARRDGAGDGIVRAFSSATAAAGARARREPTTAPAALEGVTCADAAAAAIPEECSAGGERCTNACVRNIIR